MHHQPYPVIADHPESLDVKCDRFIKRSVISDGRRGMAGIANRRPCFWLSFWLSSISLV